MLLEGMVVNRSARLARASKRTKANTQKLLAARTQYSVAPQLLDMSCLLSDNPPYRDTGKQLLDVVLSDNPPHRKPLCVCTYVFSW